jgi:isopentenyl-diphosphate Delta-isomerase
MKTNHVILVNERNRCLGSAEKLAAHRAGSLHRAFSVFLSDPSGRILLQRRHSAKYHSADLWANSCCGHPRPGELTKGAARRRLGEELGLTVDLSFGFQARYRASFANGLHENEIVYVYFGQLHGTPIPDRREVTDLRLEHLTDIRASVRRAPEAYAYWFRHYLNIHFDELASWIERLAPARPTRANSRRQLPAISAT